MSTADFKIEKRGFIAKLLVEEEDGVDYEQPIAIQVENEEDVVIIR